MLYEICNFLSFFEVNISVAAKENIVLEIVKIKKIIFFACIFT
jgi:hypothetical protein